MWESGVTTFTVHTSGSTGVPKDIVLHRSDMIHSARATCTHYAISHKSVLGCPLSFDYIAGKMMAVRAWVSGARLVALEVSNNFVLPDNVSFDLVCIVPSMIPNLLRHPEWSQRISNVLIGGAAPSPSSLKALTECGYSWEISYGMTETCSHIALAGKDGIYRSMPGVEFSTDHRGCLVITAPGYTWKTLVTNDAVELIDHRSFHWKGRIDGVINTGGIKLFPEELERLYEPRLQGVEYAVTSRPSATWGQEVVIVTTAAAETLMDALSDSDIPHLKLPKAVISVPALPRTPTGKPDRKAIAVIAAKSGN